MLGRIICLFLGHRKPTWGWCGRFYIDKGMVYKKLEAKCVRCPKIFETGPVLVGRRLAKDSITNRGVITLVTDN